MTAIANLTTNDRIDGSMSNWLQAMGGVQTEVGKFFHLMGVGVGLPPQQGEAAMLSNFRILLPLAEILVIATKDVMDVLERAQNVTTYRNAFAEAMKAKSVDVKAARQAFAALKAMEPPITLDVDEVDMEGMERDLVAAERKANIEDLVKNFDAALDAEIPDVAAAQMTLEALSKVTPAISTKDGVNLSKLTDKLENARRSQSIATYLQVYKDAMAVQNYSVAGEALSNLRAIKPIVSQVKDGVNIKEMQDALARAQTIYTHLTVFQEAIDTDPRNLDGANAALVSLRAMEPVPTKIEGVDFDALDQLVVAYTDPTRPATTPQPAPNGMGQENKDDTLPLEEVKTGAPDHVSSSASQLDPDL